MLQSDQDTFSVNLNLNNQQSLNLPENVRIPQKPNVVIKQEDLIEKHNLDLSKISDREGKFKSRILQKSPNLQMIKITGESASVNQKEE